LWSFPRKQRETRLPYPGLIAVLLALGLAAAGARAAEWTLGGGLGARAESIGNPSFAVPAGPSLLRLALALELTLAAKAEAWDAQLSGAATRYRANDSAFASGDGSLALRLARRFERDSLEASAEWRRIAPPPGAAPASGAVQTRFRRDELSAGAGWQRQLTERLALNAAARALRSRPEGPQGPGRFETSTSSVSGGLAYALTPRTGVNATLSAARSDTDPFATRSSTASAQLGVTHRQAERLTLSASYGPSRTRTETAALAAVCPVPLLFCEAGLVPFAILPARTERVGSGYAYSAAATWQAAPNASLSLSASRSATPSGSGFLAETDSYSAALKYQLAENLSLEADALLRRADSLAGTGRTRTQRLGGSLAWQLDSRWFLELGAWQTRAGLPGGLEPRSDAVFVGLRYRPRERRL
jgi:predicted porin